VGRGQLADAQVVLRAADNDEILDAAWISLKVALINASGAVILGTLAGFGLARFASSAAASRSAR
jgi:ABC-type spermidine/putrescine transport system permease subunit II